MLRARRPWNDQCSANVTTRKIRNVRVVKVTVGVGASAGGDDRTCVEAGNLHTEIGGDAMVASGRNRWRRWQRAGVAAAQSNLLD